MFAARLSRERHKDVSQFPTTQATLQYFPPFQLYAHAPFHSRVAPIIPSQLKSAAERSMKRNTWLWNDLPMIPDGTLGLMVYTTILALHVSICWLLALTLDNGRDECSQDGHPVKSPCLSFSRQESTMIS